MYMEMLDKEMYAGPKSNNKHGMANNNNKKNDDTHNNRKINKIINEKCVENYIIIK